MDRGGFPGMENENEGDRGEWGQDVRIGTSHIPRRDRRHRSGRGCPRRWTKTGWSRARDDVGEIHDDGGTGEGAGGVSRDGLRCGC